MHKAYNSFIHAHARFAISTGSKKTTYPFVFIENTIPDFLRGTLQNAHARESGKLCALTRRTFFKTAVFSGGYTTSAGENAQCIQQNTHKMSAMCKYAVIEYRGIDWKADLCGMFSATHLSPVFLFWEGTSQTLPSLTLLLISGFLGASSRPRAIRHPA